MPRMGRPPKLYVLTTTRIGDPSYRVEQPFAGIRSLSNALNLSDAIISQMLVALGGEFTRKRETEGGHVLLEHVKRVD